MHGTFIDPHGALMLFPRGRFHGTYMGSMDSHCAPVVLSWTSMVNSWCYFHGLLWCLDRAFMVLVLCFDGIFTDSHRVLPWYFHGIFTGSRGLSWGLYGAFRDSYLACFHGLRRYFRGTLSWRGPWVFHERLPWCFRGPLHAIFTKIL